VYTLLVGVWLQDLNRRSMLSQITRPRWNDSSRGVPLRSANVRHRDVDITRCLLLLPIIDQKLLPNHRLVLLGVHQAIETRLHSAWLLLLEVTFIFIFLRYHDHIFSSLQLGLVEELLSTPDGRRCRIIRLSGVHRPRLVEAAIEGL